MAGFGSSHTSQTSVWSGFKRVHLGQNQSLSTGGAGSYSFSSSFSSKSFKFKFFNPSYKIIAYPTDWSLSSDGIYMSNSGINILSLCFSIFSFNKFSMALIFI